MEVLVKYAQIQIQIKIQTQTHTMAREWTPEEEVVLLRAICHFKPVGECVGRPMEEAKTGRLTTRARPEEALPHDCHSEGVEPATR